MLVENNKKNWQIFIVLIFAFILYYPSIYSEFTNWDDDTSIIENPLIRSIDWSTIQKIFTTFYFWNYQPFLHLSSAIEYYFFGINHMTFHLVSVILFLLNIFLVYLFVWNLSEKMDIAIVASILFAVHPTRVEVVVWASDRCYLLCLSFYLMALIQYIKYLGIVDCRLPIADWKSYKRHYFLAILFFVVACLCDRIAVSMSLILILIDYFFKRKLHKKVFLDKIPFFIISIVFGIVAIIAAVQIKSNEYSFIERIEFAGYAIVFYWYKLIAPFNLSIIYPYPYTSDLLPVYYWIFPLMAIVICGIILYTYKFTRKIIFGFGFFFASIVFMLQLFAIGDSFAADRYSYIAFIGIFYLVGESYHNLTKLTWFSLKRIQILNILLLTIVLLFSFSTFNRIKVWKNSITLYTDVIEKYPNVRVAYNNRARAKKTKGDLEGSLKDFDTAINLITKGSLADPYKYRANLRIDLKDYLGALEDLNKSLALAPTAFAYNNRGRINLLQGKYSKAINDFNNALFLKDGENYQVFFNRGIAYYNLKLFNRSIDDFTKAIGLFPSFSDAYFSRGTCKYLLADVHGACDDWHRAKQLNNHIKASRALEHYCSKKN